MFQAFLEALNNLTTVRLRRSDVPVRKTIVLIYYPIVGLFFGLGALFIVRCVQLKLPYLAAFLVVCFWTLLSGGKHLHDFGRFLSAFTDSRPENTSRTSALSLEAVSGILLVLLGKTFALVQAQVLDVTSVSLMVLFIPLVSRYVSLMLALGGEVISDYDNLPDKGLVVVTTTATLILVGTLSLALALALLVTGLIVAVLLRWAVLSRIGANFKPVTGAVIEASEMTMLWIPPIFAALGLNLTLLRLV